VRDLRTASPSHWPHRSTLAVLAVGALITALLTWTSWSLNNHNEGRLLNLQAKQVESVLTEAVPTTQTPLEVGTEIAQASDGNVATFRNYMAHQVGTESGFSSASLWERTDGTTSLVTTLGAPSRLGASSSALPMALVERAFSSPTFVVAELSGPGGRGLGYAFAPSGQGERFAVFAERPLPANRQARVAQNSAFSDLNYAIYLGAVPRAPDLLTTDFAHFPVAGQTTSVTIPFGNTALTTVVAARVPLGGALSANLPWMVGLVGIVLTLGAAVLTERLVRRRKDAEGAESEVRRLFGELESLYGEQRTIAETLQRALLPQALPSIPGVSVAARYQPGARGVDVGGDWYSVMYLGDGKYVFVVGDVSGRGLAAASIMARLRFTVRAHAMDGDPPALILDKCNRQLTVDADGHFATVLVGVGDLNRQQLVIANAGHLPPHLSSKEHIGFVATQPGLPVGVADYHYESVTIPFRPGSTLMAFTDGLVERRTEILDVGLKRFEEAARTHADCSLDDTLTHVLEDLGAADTEDDIAIIGLRWEA
jgi:serine phosphatase RsbU (regulator of sigma subunit)